MIFTKFLLKTKKLNISSRYYFYDFLIEKENSIFSEFHGFKRQESCYTNRDGNGGSNGGNSNTVTLECCGEAGKREFFNSETKMCCADGSIKPLGLC